MRRRIAIGLALASGALAWAGGTPENALLIIDPTSTDSMYVGNYYKNARNIPNSSVLYMRPGAADYATFVSQNLNGLAGTLANRGTTDLVDYIIVAPTADFFVPAGGLVVDQCYPVTRFSITGAYTTAFIAPDILAAGGTYDVQTLNQYYSTLDTPRNFDASNAYWLGNPSAVSTAKRYYLSALLGYTGPEGNTLAEILAMIDRSVAVDGTRPPGGTFYFMNNTADPDRNVRASQFSGVRNSINANGGTAVVQTGALPTDPNHPGDPNFLLACNGVMTGAADLNFAAANVSLRPGAFGDHLTSWAATFDLPFQTKVSAWIARGASGSWGTVQEPCNYTGKFPHARLHLWYFRGVSLGEAAFRAAGYVPFEGLLYGDPLTRTWSPFPILSVTGVPGTPVTGSFQFTPSATATASGATISRVDLLVDGVLTDPNLPNNQPALFDTTELSDGWHDLRVLATDSTPVKNIGRWVGSVTVNNLGRSATLAAAPSSGDWTTAFSFDCGAVGSGVQEVRLIQNGRVVAAASGAAASFDVFGLTLGAGTVQVQCEARFGDGSLVRSAPQLLTIANSGGAASGQAPTAFSYTRQARRDAYFVAELPATYDNAASPPTGEIVSPPLKTAIPAGQTGVYRLMQPLPNAHGIDAFTFRINSVAGASNTAQVTIVYDGCPDVNGDGVVDQDDLDEVLFGFGACVGNAAYDRRADFDLSGCIDQEDLDQVLFNFGQTCP